MQSYELNLYLNDNKLLQEKIDELLKKEVIKNEKKDLNEIQGHLQKAEHNLSFVQKILTSDYLDWAITGCYYASYHAALALIITKSFSSKNHFATLLLLIKYFYKKGLTADDIQILASFLDYQDILFYVESKNKREDATYSTKVSYTKKDVEQLRIKAVLFVSKIKELINTP